MLFLDWKWWNIMGMNFVNDDNCVFQNLKLFWNPFIWISFVNDCSCYSCFWKPTLNSFQWFFLHNWVWTLFAKWFCLFFFQTQNKKIATGGSTTGGNTTTSPNSTSTSTSTDTQTHNQVTGDTSGVTGRPTRSNGQCNWHF